VNIAAGAYTHVGKKRTRNEDAILALALPRQGEHLLAVADGLGGLANGAAASNHALRRVRVAALRCEHDSARSCVEAALEVANQELVRFAEGDPTKALGTTFVGVLTQGATFVVLHIGDSRAYLLRSGELKQLTQDHSVVAEKVRVGILSAEEAAASPERNQVTRCIGVDEAFELEVAAASPLAAGDRLLTCSDGLHGPVSDADIARLLQGAPAPLRAARDLVAAALAAGAPDNVSVALAFAG
jgi:protein phosphatase